MTSVPRLACPAVLSDAGGGDMLVIPAVDIKGGRCVRLRQGRAEEETVFGEDPVEMARHWESEGAGYLHVVDLDGAFDGVPVNVELVKGIISETQV